MLIQQLRDLEGNGVVIRKVYPEAPPKVEYALTEEGLALRRWLHFSCGQCHGREIAFEIRQGCTSAATDPGQFLRCSRAGKSPLHAGADHFSIDPTRDSASRVLRRY